MHSSNSKAYSTHNQTGLLLMQLLEGLVKPASYEKIMEHMEKAIKQQLDPQMRHTVNATLESGVRMGFIHKRGNLFYVKPLTHHATIQTAADPSRTTVGRRTKSAHTRICSNCKSKQSIKIKRIRKIYKRGKPVTRATAKASALRPHAHRKLLGVRKHHSQPTTRSLFNLCLYCGHKHEIKLPNCRSKHSRCALLNRFSRMLKRSRSIRSQERK